MRDFQTERLTVRPIVEADWRGIQSIWNDFNSTEYVIYDNPKNTDSAALEKRIAGWAEANRNGKEHIFFSICLADEMIGFVSLNICEGGYEIGYGFLNKAQGKGYAKESINAILGYMKALGVEKIFAGTGLRNYPSVGLLKSLGFEMVGTEQVTFHKDADGNDIYFEGGNFEKRL